MATTDFLVVGGGIIGISIARELRRRHADLSVTVLEKEPACGRHASGRNSGVLHAGFYYSADSLKARFTRDGNAALKAYCEERGLPLNRCGKLVVAKSAAEHPQLDELLRRGAANGVALESVTEAEAKRIEPRVKTCERAIWSPNTATADPGAVLAAMREDAEREGVHFVLGTAFRRMRGNEIETSQGRWSAGYVVNCAGLHADRIAPVMPYFCRRVRCGEASSCRPMQPKYSQLLVFQRRCCRYQPPSVQGTSPHCSSSRQYTLV
jgi:L-2-hydroxyglutarate oxidase LhgO